MRTVVRMAIVVAALGAGCLPAPPEAVRTPAVSRGATASPTAATAPSGAPPSLRLVGPIQRLVAATGFVATEPGLLATSDGGRAWELRTRTSGAFFSELRFTDADHGWAVIERWGSDQRCAAPDLAAPCSTLMSTTDGGRSWRDRLSRPTAGIDGPAVTSLQAVEGTTAWVIATAAGCSAGSCPRELLATRDAGVSWVVQRSAPGLTFARFASADRGWVAVARAGDVNGGAEILATSDGGGTWQSQQLTATSVVGLDSASEVVAWVLTRDGGYCTASSCTRYELIRTNDGGRTWERLGNPLANACSGGHLRGPLFASASVGWLGISLGAGGAGVGAGGLLATRDSGRSWECRTTPQNVAAISAADPLHVWVRSDPAGRDPKGTQPALFATDDGGATWRAVAIALR